MKNLIALTIVGMLCCGAPALVSRAYGAQDHTRTSTGRVLDKHEAAVSRAVVYLKNTKSLVVKTYITDAGGSYGFQGLRPNVD